MQDLSPFVSTSLAAWVAVLVACIRKAPKIGPYVDGQAVVLAVAIAVGVGLSFAMGGGVAIAVPRGVASGIYAVGGVTLGAYGAKKIGDSLAAALGSRGAAIEGMAQPLLATLESAATPTARELYETYCAHSDWKNYQGLPCPQWDVLTEAVRGHWEAVATSLLPEGSPAEATSTPLTAGSGS